ncbi:sensor histidine kinase [Arthrobacter castelli]|uniref:sensor histidine kinase n=1 Tax=Arthrobacter castelli TaxID=271431 RepID=UPI000423479E|nr:histidine kinase [Arthrobacter castelli]
MPKLGSEEWSGLAMLVVSVAVAGPVLFDVVQTTIPRGWWITLFTLLIVALLVAAVSERPTRLRYIAYATTVVSSWVVVLTAPNMGLLPVLLVVTAAVGAYIIPLRLGFVVVGLNTAVLAFGIVQQADPVTEAMISAGFYLLIQLAALLGSVALIREQRMRRELTEAHIDLQAATVLLSESARTTERLRISRDLHDLIGHQLTVLTLELETARHRDGERAGEHIERANFVARELLADVRATVGELRAEPPDLTQALGEVVRNLPGLDVWVDVDAGVRIGEQQTTALVRTVQEVVTNTIRHGDARELWIEVSADETGVILTAVDDGRGASDLVPGNGLRGLTERIEALGGDVTYGGKAGFMVTARVPAT